MELVDVRDVPFTRGQKDLLRSEDHSKMFHWTISKRKNDLPKTHMTTEDQNFQ